MSPVNVPPEKPMRLNASLPNALRCVRKSLQERIDGYSNDSRAFLGRSRLLQPGGHASVEVSARCEEPLVTDGRRHST